MIRSMQKYNSWTATLPSHRCTGKESIRRQRLICRADRDLQLCKNMLDCDTHKDRGGGGAGGGGGGDERGGGSQLCMLTENNSRLGGSVTWHTTRFIAGCLLMTLGSKSGADFIWLDGKWRSKKEGGREEGLSEHAATYFVWVEDQNDKNVLNTGGSKVRLTPAAVVKPPRHRWQN